jgi:hypothetical protein
VRDHIEGSTARTPGILNWERASRFGSAIDGAEALADGVGQLAWCCGYRGARSLYTNPYMHVVDVPARFGIELYFHIVALKASTDFSRDDAVGSIADIVAGPSGGQLADSQSLRIAMGRSSSCSGQQESRKCGYGKHEDPFHGEDGDCEEAMFRWVKSRGMKNEDLVDEEKISVRTSA